MGGKRRKGTGSVRAVSNGWRWSIRAGGAEELGSLVETREECEAELARRLADPASFQRVFMHRERGTGGLKQTSAGKWRWVVDGKYGASLPTREAAEADLVARLVGKPTAPKPARRAQGTGSVHRNGTMWRWSIGSRTGRSFGTREEAQAELDRVLADPAYVPQPKRAEPWRSASPPAPKVESARAFVPLPPEDPEILAAEAATPQFAPDGTCLPCAGEGIDRREGGTRACLCCWGTGSRAGMEAQEELEAQLAENVA